MKMIVAPASIVAFYPRYLGPLAVCILMAVALIACTGGDEDSATDDRVLELEAKVHSLEKSLEALVDENAELKGEIAVLRERSDDLDARLQELEEVASKVESALPAKEQWSKGKDEVFGAAGGRRPGKDRQAGGGFRRRDPLRRPPERGDRPVLERNHIQVLFSPDCHNNATERSLF